MPSIDEITKGKTKIDALRPIPIEELLGREVIEAQSDLMKLAIKNKIILITGAGGSIGSELCRQVIQHMPKKIVLLEISEENLYKINEELLQKNIDTRFSELRILFCRFSYLDIIEYYSCSSSLYFIY